MTEKSAPENHLTNAASDASSSTTRTVDSKEKNFLTGAEMKKFLSAARRRGNKKGGGGRHCERDYAMMLVTFRHGLRVSELCDLRISDLDLDTAHLFVRRIKGSLSTHQPVEGDELRAMRAWLRIREERADSHSPYLFLSERGPLTRQAISYLVERIGKRAD